MISINYISNDSSFFKPPYNECVYYFNSKQITKMDIIGKFKYVEIGNRGFSVRASNTCLKRRKYFLIYG